jgi:hypothetical protein
MRAHFANAVERRAGDADEVLHDAIDDLVDDAHRGLGIEQIVDARNCSGDRVFDGHQRGVGRA